MFKQLKLLRISLKTHWGYIKKNNLLALFNFLIIKNSWKRRKGRFACLPRRCALGVLPLTTPASAHLHADEQWQSRKNRVRRAGRQGERKRRREDKGRRRRGGECVEAEALRIKRENRLRSAVQLWSGGSGLRRLCCDVLQHWFCSWLLLYTAISVPLYYSERPFSKQILCYG